MVKHLKMLGCTVCLALGVGAWSQAVSAGQISGELKKWHKVTLTFDGPETSETANPNPFLYYRLNVTFKHQGSNKSYLVPGYYAADGDAANTSADSGNKWCVHFAPDAAGTWKYNVSFRKGPNVAVSERKNAGQSAAFMDGQSGSFDIGPTDKTGRDFRGKGLLRYVGKHHLRFAETGEYFLKCGADAPENFLAYADFDGDFKTDGHKDELIKTWAPHIRDFKHGDPTWQNGKGRGIIGAINYLASQGMNVFSFLSLNIEGDDRNVFPYTTYDERKHMDCSRLDQWEIVFAHGTSIGMYLHFKTMETENELLLDKGDLGPHRKFYYRELIARFSHHLALNWNLGEEINNATTEQKIAWANYFWTHDPYQHHIVIHNMNDPHYDLLGDASKLTGFSLQTDKPDFSQVHQRTRDYIDRSVAAGKPWVVACDEPGDATHGLITDAEDPTRDNARKNALWGNIMAGGAGVEWYFGYKHPHSDLTCQDYRTREKVWTQCRYALEFFRKHEIPFWDMKCEDEITESTNDYVLCKPGRIYLVYLKHGGKVEINVAGGNFNYGWFNPRTGDGLDGLLHTGSAKIGRKVELAAPDKNDWLLVIKGSGRLELASEQPPLPKVVSSAEGEIVLKAVSDFRIVTSHEANRIDSIITMRFTHKVYKSVFALYIAATTSRLEHSCQMMLWKSCRRSRRFTSGRLDCRTSMTHYRPNYLHSRYKPALINMSTTVPQGSCRESRGRFATRHLRTSTLSSFARTPRGNSFSPAVSFARSLPRAWQQTQASLHAKESSESLVIHLSWRAIAESA